MCVLGVVIVSCLFLCVGYVCVCVCVLGVVIVGCLCGVMCVGHVCECVHRGVSVCVCWRL